MFEDCCCPSVASSQLTYARDIGLKCDSNRLDTHNLADGIASAHTTPRRLSAAAKTFGVTVSWPGPQLVSAVSRGLRTCARRLVIIHFIVIVNRSAVKGFALSTPRRTARVEQMKHIFMGSTLWFDIRVA